MRAVLATHGTMGDVQPFLALALELERRGHDVVLAAPPNFAARAARVGVAFCPLGPGLDAQVDGPRAEPAEQALHTLSSLLPTLAQMFRELAVVAERADVLVAFPYQLAGLMVHETTRIPYVSLHFSPFGAAGGRRFAEATAPPVNTVRKEMGLGPLRDPLGLDAISTRLALFAVSQHVVRRAARWPAHYHLTGYFFLDEAHEPDPELVEFLARGERPVVVTFGSLTHERPEEVTALLLDALGRAGCRAILQRGWSELGRGPLPSSVLAADFVPHSWLFPRARCVVHAGGAGTTAAALRAGVPSVVVPHVLDQPLWARIALDLRCAGAVLPFARLTAEDLAAGLERTMSSPTIAEHAARTAEKITAEDGVKMACRLIEQACGEPDGR